MPPPLSNAEARKVPEFQEEAPTKELVNGLNGIHL